jgi:ABC-type sugar transport system ATPase subunit
MIAGFRPEHVQLANGAGDVARFTARVEAVEYLGDEQLVHLTTREKPLVAKLPTDKVVSSGEERTFVVARGKLFLFDAETENRVN